MRYFDNRKAAISSSGALPNIHAVLIPNANANAELPSLSSVLLPKANEEIPQATEMMEAMQLGREDSHGDSASSDSEKDESDEPNEFPEKQRARRGRVTGYNMFAKETAAAAAQSGNKLQSAVIAAIWRELDEHEKQKYKMRAQSMQ
jgi:hypothetical protein